VIEGKGRRVVVVDDEPMLRTLVADRLVSFGFESWAAADAFEAKKLVATKDPDAVIVDIDLGSGPNGLELIQALTRSYPYLGFVLLTNFATSSWELSVAENVGYLRKKDVTNFTTLLTVLEEVLLNAPRNSRSFVAPHEDQLDGLSQHQLSVLSMVASGLSNQDIADQQRVSVGAVEQTLKRIYSSLNLDASSNMSKRVTASHMFLRSRGARGIQSD
jgi:DNA-binding NarL/FixJ family response regulator